MKFHENPAGGSGSERDRNDEANKSHYAVVT